MEMTCDVDVLILLFLSYMHFVIFFQNIPIISLLGNWKLQEESSWLTPAAGKFCHSGISPLGWEGEPVIPENSLRGTCFPGLISTCCQTRPKGNTRGWDWFCRTGIFGQAAGRPACFLIFSAGPKFQPKLRLWLSLLRRQGFIRCLFFLFQVNISLFP